MAILLTEVQRIFYWTNKLTVRLHYISSIETPFWDAATATSVRLDTGNLPLQKDLGINYSIHSMQHDDRHPGMIDEKNSAIE